MTSERFAIPGLLFLLVGAVLASAGMPMVLAVIPLGLGVALVVCAVHEALVGLGSRR